MRIEITRNGRPAAGLLSSDDYEAMQETVAVLADRELVDSVRAGLAELRSGDYLDEDGLTEYLRGSGALGG